MVPNYEGEILIDKVNHEIFNKSNKRRCTKWSICWKIKIKGIEENVILEEKRWHLQSDCISSRLKRSIYWVRDEEVTGFWISMSLRLHQTTQHVRSSSIFYRNFRNISNSLLPSNFKTNRSFLFRKLCDPGLQVCRWIARQLSFFSSVWWSKIFDRHTMT